MSNQQEYYDSLRFSFRKLIHRLNYDYKQPQSKLQTKRGRFQRYYFLQEPQLEFGFLTMMRAFVPGYITAKLSEQLRCTRVLIRSKRRLQAGGLLDNKVYGKMYFDVYNQFIDLNELVRPNSIMPIISSRRLANTINWQTS